MSGKVANNPYRASGVVAALAEGRTGTVDWITTPKVTGDSPVTGVTAKGYFLNTTAGTITLNLPAGVAGSIVSMADYAGTWQTNNVTVAPNGSEKIGSVNASVTLDTEGQSVTLVYVDSTQGWLNTMDSTSNVRGATFVTATGGTPCAGATVCTNYKQHTFTGPGTFCVSCAGGPAGSNTVDYLVIAGGGAGSIGTGSNSGGAGGAGGYRESSGTASGCYTVSPLGACVSALPVSATPYTIAVGAGGAISPSTRSCGGAVSTFSTITSTGGGAGGAGSSTPGPGDGGPGGSGGGARGSVPDVRTQGSGDTPPTTPAQGTDGGNPGPGAPGDLEGGGGGGALTAGGNGCATAPPRIGGAGGPGATSSINATPTPRAGGGGAGAGSPPATAGPGGAGGGGTGAKGTGPTPVSAATAGTCNTGGGGGGGGNAGLLGGAGGSGVVIIRYKFQ